MAKSEWGIKRKCLKCGAFFYDMGKKNFSCPKCKESYTAASYEESKTKQLMKLAKRAAPRIDDEALDEEALLQMTEDVPLLEDDLGPDELEILDDDSELGNHDESGLSGLMHYGSDEEPNER